MINNTMTWQADQMVSHRPAIGASFESSRQNDRLNALRELVLVLLNEVESLQLLRPSQPDFSGTDLQQLVQQFETDLIEQALRRTRGNQARAARLLGVKHTTLNAKIRRYRIPLDQVKEPDKLVGLSDIAA